MIDADLLDLAISKGAVITGKPDGSEPITVLFTVDAWQAFSAAVIEQRAAPVSEAVAVGTLVKSGFNLAGVSKTHTEFVWSTDRAVQDAFLDGTKVYTTPQPVEVQRVGLTDAEAIELLRKHELRRDPKPHEYFPHQWVIDAVKEASGIKPSATKEEATPD